MSEAHPLVRYVIPSFNQGRYLKAAIESVLSQDYPALELIVVDGASTDESIDILRTINDPRLTWISEPDNGQADAIDKGFHLKPESNFKYWNWLGSDDVLASNSAVSQLVEAAESSGAAIVYGEGEYINENGVPTGIYGTEEFSYERLIHRCFICQPSVLISAKDYREVGGLNPKLQSIMDYDLWLRFATSNRYFHRIPTIVSKYRIHSNSKTAALRQTTYTEIFRLFSSKNQRFHIHGLKAP